MKISASNSGKTLLFTETIFDGDGFQESAKIGFLRFDDTKFDSVDKAVAKANTLKWKFVGEPDEDGFSAVQRA